MARLSPNEEALAYIYSRDNDPEALRAKLLTKDVARRIAVNLPRLPELLRKGRSRLNFVLQSALCR
jgi:hypothetical protein